MRDLSQVAARLKERVNSTQKSEFASMQDVSPFGLGSVAPTELDAAMRLKDALLDEFQDVVLEEIYPSQIEENSWGTFLHLQHESKLVLSTFDPSFAESAIETELKLLYGIGPAIEQALKARGINKLSDLTGHPRWGREVQHLLEYIQARDLKQLAHQLARWLPRSHPTALRLAHLIEPDALVFFDLESMGLFGRPIILLGVAHPRPDSIEIHQLLARNITEELPALTYALDRLQSAKAIVSYNGRAFDLHYLLDRLNYYGLSHRFDPVHFDLLSHARRRFRDLLPNTRLESVEREILRLERSMDIPSLLVPEFYNTYLEKRNIGPLIPILEHNKQDLLSLVLLFAKLCEP
jgi:uncharacterized protein YprB with RNaseH-like and TPR domain